MVFHVASDYLKFDEEELECGTVVVWISQEGNDSRWDAFLQSTPLGQFQQSTLWARAKTVEGWKPIRVVLTLHGEVIGGFQILRRSAWWGGIGYVSKGPVVLPQHSGLANYSAALLQRVCQTERLAALIVQPPDLCTQTDSILNGHGFMHNVAVGVNEATLIIDLRDGFESVVQRMRKETRQKVRQALTRGVSLREGHREEIGTFFDLMLATCRRQKTTPNPNSSERLLALWDAAQPSGCIRLFFAEVAGRPVTGLLCITFGETVSLWKRGWTLEESQRHPNDLGVYELLKWSCASGFKRFDFCALEEQIAIALLNKQVLSPNQERSRHLFHIRFGGRAELLPKARLYIRHRIFQIGYRMVFRKKLRAVNSSPKASLST